MLPVFSFLTPAKVRSITVEQIAKAMVSTARNGPARTAIYHYPDMIRLNR